MAGVGEARRRLHEPEAAGLLGEVERVKRLARSVVALCDHHDALRARPCAWHATSRSRTAKRRCRTSTSVPPGARISPAVSTRGVRARAAPAADAIPPCPGVKGPRATTGSGSHHENARPAGGPQASGGTGSTTPALSRTTRPIGAAHPTDYGGTTT
ncbi:DUF6415 family natural product biosynthesis protein [Streptomyces sp. UG1]|uniref:DUF6415 family natural product biosynthesis protein n=1 Tax=Streptomyces sp. UG1 TaxID=3417652 RepID=UPI003CEE7C44